MSVERRKGSKRWYGRVIVGGRVRTVSLKIEVKGAPPLPGDRHGDARYERSKREAEAALTRMRDALRTGSEDELLRKAYELRTGDKVPRFSTRFLYLHFRRALGPRGKRRSPRYLAQIASRLRAFHDFLARRYPRVETLLDVSERMAIDFLDEIESDGVKSSTYNHWLVDLRSSLGRILKRASMEARNPFRNASRRESDDIQSKEPFSPEELERIFSVAKADADPGFYDLIAVAVCTAMRRTDCCLLRWDAIDLKRGLIATKAAKTKKPLLIPILPMLQPVLDRLRAERDKMKRPEGVDYVFPETAQLAQRNPDAISNHMRDILTKAGFSSEQLQVPKANGGKRAVCVRGFSSLRTTFVTLALNAGVPIELVRKVTGHTTDAIVRTRYHNPSNEELRTQFRERMPAVFGTNGQLGKERMSPSLQTWLKSQCDRMLNGDDVQTVVTEIKQRLTSTAAC